MRVLVVVRRSSEGRPLARLVETAPFGRGGPVKVVAVAPRALLPPPPPPPWSPGTWVSSAELTARARNDTERAARRLASAIARTRGTGIETEVRTGTPQDEIVAAAFEWSADVTVLGIEEGLLLDRWRDTRIARAVVSRAPCSVFVVRYRRERLAERPLLEDALLAGLRA
jgi:nucleotide-binding universal stress UspA family protein